MLACALLACAVLCHVPCVLPQLSSVMVRDSPQVPDMQEFPQQLFIKQGNVQNE